MVSRSLPTVSVTFSASGAVSAARSGSVVVIVDVIHMSTSAEALLAAGAAAVYGAAPAAVDPPVPVDPLSRGLRAGEAAGRGNGVIVFSEPRGPTDDGARRLAAAPVIQGIEQAGAELGGVYPNMGLDSPEYCDAAGKVVVIVSYAGGVAFDAAATAGAVAVLTATVARGAGRKGWEAADIGVKRAIAEAERLKTGITYVAASANAPEDVLAACELARATVAAGFIDLGRR